MDSDLRPEQLLPLTVWVPATSEDALLTTKPVELADDLEGLSWRPPAAITFGTPLSTTQPDAHCYARISFSIRSLVTPVL